MDTHQSGDFIPYPIHRVVGTIADAKESQAALDELLGAGFNRVDIDVLHGEDDLDRLDPTGAKHGVLAQIQRTVIRTAGPAEEFKHLTHHLEDVRAGRFVIMVLAREREKRHVAADILNAHGAEFVGFYGRWTWQSLEAGPADATDPVARGTLAANEATATATATSTLLAPGKSVGLSSLVTPAGRGIASRILAKTAGGNVTLFAFDAGKALAEHTSPFEALAFVLEGVCRFTVDGVEARATTGTVVRLPAHSPHALEAVEDTRLLLVMLRETTS